MADSSSTRIPNSTDYASHAFQEVRGAEIHQQSQTVAAEAQVGEEPLSMQRYQALNRHLPCHPKPPGFHFGRQGRLGHGLKQTGPRFPMLPVGRVHHMLRQFVLHGEEYIGRTTALSALPSRLGVFA
jgi:hypothetical protein